MNNKNILLSVIIPVYNADKYLKNTFDSLISQTVFQNLEIIIINDGSTDNSRNICEEFQKNYDNAVLINQQNFGVSAARNAGIKISRGKYITFLDADDYIENNLYEKELDLIISNNADITGFDNHDNFFNEGYTILKIDSIPGKRRDHVQSCQARRTDRGF